MTSNSLFLSRKCLKPFAFVFRNMSEFLYYHVQNLPRQLSDFSIYFSIRIFADALACLLISSTFFWDLSSVWILSSSLTLAAEFIGNKQINSTYSCRKKHTKISLTFFRGFSFGLFQQLPHFCSFVLQLITLVSY